MGAWVQKQSSGLPITQAKLAMLEWDWALNGTESLDIDSISGPDFPRQGGWTWAIGGTFFWFCITNECYHQSPSSLAGPCKCFLLQKHKNPTPTNVLTHDSVDQKFRHMNLFPNHWVVYIQYVQLLTCQSHLNKVVLKTEEERVQAQSCFEGSLFRVS